MCIVKQRRNLIRRVDTADCKNKVRLIYCGKAQILNLALTDKSKIRTKEKKFLRMT